VDGGALLGVDADDVSAGLGKVSHPLLRLHDHLHVGNSKRQSDNQRSSNRELSHGELSAARSLQASRA
jgi:hypothetical protein